MTRTLDQDSAPTRFSRLYSRAADEGWSSTRLDSALDTAREWRYDLAAAGGKGKRCGQGFIPRGNTCHKGVGALTPASLAQSPHHGTARGSDWRRKAAIAAGVTAGAVAVGLPAASFFVSGSPPGRRAARGVETFAREAGRGLMSWGRGPLAPVGVPLGMGLMAGAEGARAGRIARRVSESWAAAPGFARGAAGLASRKTTSAEARRSYLQKLQNAWLAGQKPITPTEASRRAAQVRKVEEEIARLSRQAATRSRAARRAARIGRTGAPFRSSPTVSEAWLRSSLQSDPISRTPAALTAGFLRNLQSSRQGLNARRVRFYDARRDAEDNRGKPCGESHIAKGKKCHKGAGEVTPPAGAELTPAKVLAAAALVGGSAAAIAWSKRDSADLRAAMQSRPLADTAARKPNLIQRLLAERRAARCGRRGDALPLSAINECAESTFAEIYLSKDGNTVFKVQKEPDLAVAKREFKIHSAAYELGVPTARPLAIHPKTGVIRMEHLKGRTGEEIFGEGFDASHYPSYGLQLSAAMRKLHRAGLSHGDCHVGNWIESSNGVHLIDWGMGSRQKQDLIFELEDSALGLGLGIGVGPKGQIRLRHPALDGYEDRLKTTLIALDFLEPRTPEWRQLIDEHYDALDAMLSKAAKSRA
jgi:hypothetical protein